MPRKALNQDQEEALGTLVLTQQREINGLREHNGRLAELASRMSLMLLDLQWLNHDREDHVGQSVSRCREQACKEVAALTAGLKLPF